MTAAEELVEVNAALLAAYRANAQAYSTEERSRTLLNINDLIKRKTNLEQAIAAQTSGGFSLGRMQNL